MTVLVIFRERERKLEARNEAITLSIAELEKKIQLKVTSSLGVELNWYLLL